MARMRAHLYPKGDGQFFQLDHLQPINLCHPRKFQKFSLSFVKTNSYYPIGLIMGKGDSSKCPGPRFTRKKYFLKKFLKNFLKLNFIPRHVPTSKFLEKILEHTEKRVHF